MRHEARASRLATAAGLGAGWPGLFPLVLALCPACTPSPASIHDCDLSDIGIMDWHRESLAPASGDLHKCIEHVHGILMGAFSE